ncbi:AraC family transcriptional regulator [Marinobacterium marinum]|uniref:AraC family transcriptional regulator n=1 Tax=Marinobacterium marinum TaxID=2756129 RepID=A0A7W1WY23_9GAMM|nr:AraC family transcriptional regulator [Marinobacterium marinum]MBA4502191.1 AraC family transcriptional regulator [Marinobacterium marinum]
MPDANTPQFWRDSRMPHVELRQIRDTLKTCYAPHSHIQWSLGAITQGCNTFLYRDKQLRVDTGTLVIIDPDAIHACNPIDNQPWGYRMLYIDTDWLTALRYNSRLLESPHWRDIPVATLSDPHCYASYLRMTDCLIDPHRALLEKQTALTEYLTTLLHKLAKQPLPPLPTSTGRIPEIASFLRAHATEDLSLDMLCQHFEISAGHLIRAFKAYSGFTPHGYLINCRVQLGQQALKAGNPIAEAALQAGFADQPHFQRTFKRMVAATPNQYRRTLLNQH